MSQPTLPAICEKCHNLDPNSHFGELYVWSSSSAGSPPTSCRFCQFIYDAATTMVPSFASAPQIHASLQSVPKEDRIDFSFGGRLSMQIHCRPRRFTDSDRYAMLAIVC
jgi:hypothetical protein